MGAGVLAALQGVPVPGGPALVVAGQLPQPEPGRVGERLRQAQDRRLLRQRLGQVDHLDLPGGEGGDQGLDGVGHGVGSPSDGGRRARWNSKRFSSRCRSMWKLLGPTASTLATRQVSSGSLDRRLGGGGELVNGGDRGRLRDAGRAGDPGQVGAGGGGRGEPADAEQALVVEDDVGEVRRGVAGQGGEPAQVHQHRAVPVEHDHLALRLGQGDAEAHRGGQPHGVLEVEEAGPVPERVQLGRHRPHDGDDGAAGQLVVDRLQTLDPLHRQGLPHEVAGEQQGHRRQGRLGQGRRPGHLELDGGRVGQLVGDDPEGVQDRPGRPASPSARVGLAQVAAIADQHEQRELVQLGQRDDAVDRLEQPWFCISMADRRPARWAPAEIDPSSSLASGPGSSRGRPRPGG